MSSIPVTPSFRLDGKRALVTGAGRGIGTGAAAALAEAGAEVVLAARTTGEVETLAAELRERGLKAQALTLDVTDVERARAIIDEVPLFDILVNNAGTNRPAHFLDVTTEDFDVISAINVRAAFFLAQAVARKLIAAKRPGSIIHMASQMGHVGGAKRTVYCATKHAIIGLTKAMAVDLGATGVRVNAICPTFIETPMTRPFMAEPDFETTFLSKIKLGRVGQIEDVMGAVVFLASEASSLMTGSSLMIDGGWTAD